ncbi:unnamed protein product [Orchesella dallaii]|uniref:N-acetylserotonin O-methyltransferase-like protein n=1 Tax=Orchesella dallaii TaxID=48710 RepID=A0ABP1QX84_9HEXA
MLFEWLKLLSGKRIILASGSPRRKEILESIKLGIEVQASDFEENLNPDDFKHFSEFVTETAYGKANDVVQKTISDTIPVHLVIAADTMVVIDQQIMGKPKSNHSATTMLKTLSGRTHKVYTGVVLIWPETNEITRFCESTNVTFAKLSDTIISGYVSTGEPLDKAGGYGIQGLGGSLIESIEGDFYTVMGLPLHKFSYHVNDHYKNVK